MLFRLAAAGAAIAMLVGEPLLFDCKYFERPDELRQVVSDGTPDDNRVIAKHHGPPEGGQYRSFKYAT
jgi:hypothetical protein